MNYDMKKGQSSTATKWAHDEKAAVRLMLAKNPDKDGNCVFKRGGSGKILNVKQVDPLTFD
tara:strand:+ start:184 stop:366 length:183 start_codon:yes stop_codon:yes gene_type:complete